MEPEKNQNLRIDVDALTKETLKYDQRKRDTKWDQKWNQNVMQDVDVLTKETLKYN